MNVYNKIPRHGKDAKRTIWYSNHWVTELKKKNEVKNEHIRMKWKKTKCVFDLKMDHKNEKKKNRNETATSAQSGVHPQ